MRRLFFGCSIFVFLFGVVACVAGYLLVWKPIEAVASDWGSGVENIREARSLDEGLENQSAFAEPTDGVLTERQVTRYVAVQRAIVGAQSQHATVRERVAQLRDGGELSHDMNMQKRPTHWQDAVRELSMWAYEHMTPWMIIRF